MEQYTIITENDESKWDDITGLQYHFPSRYLPFLGQGTKVVYYKGKIKNVKYRSKRLADTPHYFGIAEIKSLQKDENTNSYFATIVHFSLFKKAVPSKLNNLFIESIPQSRVSNYWRDGVRPINKMVYTRILSAANVESNDAMLNDQKEDDLTSTEQDGGQRKIYTTVYERNKKLRDQAIKIHGYDCMVCGFNYKKVYGTWGEGYIHVHHIKPLSSSKEKVNVNPAKDLVVVCANCHAMIHRKRDKVLTIENLRIYTMTLKVR